MKKLILIVALVAVTVLAIKAYAGTDQVCMNNCLSQGHLYGYCRSICSY